MATIRAHTLQCGSCGAPIGVRNVLKAKMVVCPACGTAHARRGAAFEALDAVERKEPPGVVCLGLRGALPDGRALEVVGRVRFGDSKGSSRWFWDEWLLLAEDGEYLWLQEEHGRFELHQRFVPDEPFDGLDSKKGQEVFIDGERHVVSETGHPAIELFEGELTWEPRIGDRVRYIDTRGESRMVSIEWSDEEIEFFERRKLPQSEAWDLVGLTRLNEALATCRAEVKSLKRTWTARALSGLWMLGLGAIVLVLGVYWNFTTPEVEAGTQPVNVAWGVDELPLAEVSLEEGRVYRLVAKATSMGTDSDFELYLTDPGGTHQPMLHFLGPTYEPSDGQVQFTAEHAGSHEVYVGGGLPMDVGTPVEVQWAIQEIDPTRQAAPLTGLFVMVGSVLVFGVPFLLGTEASSKRWRQFRQSRKQLRDETLRASQVQEQT